MTLDDLELKILRSSGFETTINNALWPNGHVSAHSVCGANRNSHAASSHPSSQHVTLDDLEAKISVLSVFGHNEAQIS